MKLGCWRVSVFDDFQTRVTALFSWDTALMVIKKYICCHKCTSTHYMRQVGCLVTNVKTSYTMTSIRTLDARLKPLLPSLPIIQIIFRSSIWLPLIMSRSWSYQSRRFIFPRSIVGFCSKQNLFRLVQCNGNLFSNFSILLVYFIVTLKLKI